MRYHFILWKWRQDTNLKYSYSARNVNAMVAMIRQWANGLKYRILCITDDHREIKCETAPLWDDMRDALNATNATLPSCYRRLKLYSNAQQKDLDIKPGDRIVSIDLDTLITGPLWDIVKHEGIYVGWELAGTHHPRVFNGSLQMFTAGTLDDIWSEFDPHFSPKEARNANYLGSDQAWLSYRLINREGCYGLKSPEVVSWPKQSKIQGFRSATRLIFFHGMTKPWDKEARAATPWIERYYMEDHHEVAV